MEKRYRYVMTGLIIAFFAVMIAGLCIGSYALSPAEIFQTFIGKGTSIQEMVIYKIRLPRLFVATMVGIALSTSGCILQTVTKNELAEPGIIGINAGASLAVVLLISFGGATYYNAIGTATLFVMPIAAIAGAVISALIIYTLSYKKGISPTRLILVGIGVNGGIQAVITLYQLSMSKGDYNQALTWISGSLWGSSWKYFFLILPFVICFVGISIYKARTLDMMDLGDELATGLGVEVEKERKKFFAIAVILAAVATAIAGNIAFLGLIAPQIAKRVVGPVHQKQIKAAALISAIIIMVADIVSKNLFSPIELPVGISISIIGVPYFVYLMMKEK